VTGQTPRGAPAAAPGGERLRGGEAREREAGREGGEAGGRERESERDREGRQRREAGRGRERERRPTSLATTTTLTHQAEGVLGLERVRGVDGAQHTARGRQHGVHRVCGDGRLVHRRVALRVLVKT
jgi:hypothetical protein